MSTKKASAGGARRHDHAGVLTTLKLGPADAKDAHEASDGAPGAAAPFEPHGGPPWGEEEPVAALRPHDAAHPPRLIEALSALEKSDPNAARPLATLHAAAADFLRIVAVLPQELPAEIRAAVDAVTARF